MQQSSNDGETSRSSLRSRIIAFFILFSILPLVVLGLGGYVQLRQTLTSSLERRSAAAVDRVSRQIEERYRVAEAYLPGLRHLLRTDAAPPDDHPDGRERVLPAGIWFGSGGPFLAVDVVDGAGNVVRTFTDPGVADRDSDGACAGTITSDIQVSADLTAAGEGSPAGRLSARLAPEFLLLESDVDDPPGADGRVLLLDRSHERLIDRYGCPVGGDLPDGLLPLLVDVGGGGEGRSGGTLLYEQEDDDLVISHAALSRPPWTVIATTTPAKAGAAAQELGTGFLLLVLGVGTLTSIGFALLLRPVSRSLNDLTRAMGQISEGNLNPWLPPPSSTEMGDLALATSEMASRIGSTVERMEQKRESAFVGDMAKHLAHEVRNPLSSIRLNLQSLDREISKGSIPSDYPDVMNLCLNEIHRLDHLVGEVLTLGRLPEPSLRPCSLQSIVEASVEIVRPEIEEAGLYVETRVDAGRDQVLADQNQLTALFVNLLLNAREAVPPGGHVRITLENRPGPDGDRRMWVSARVADDGPGVPPELRDKIFRPFFSTRGGSGIGLAVARSVARAHEGDLYFDKNSELTPGAEFVLILPLHRVEEEDEETGDTARDDRSVLPFLSGQESKNGA